MPDISVIIPTHGRADRLGVLLRALAAQTLAPDRFEVLVGFDGADAEAEDAARRAWPEERRGSLVLRALERRGQASVRNALIKEARSPLLVFLNDDMVPAPDLLEAHGVAQREARERCPGGAIVIGGAPWVVRTPDRMLDRLIRETSMIFFHDQMTERDPWRDWGFRHAWLLNLSVHAAAVREVGGLTVFPSTYGYEDDELAYRLHERFGMPVLYRPGAVAHHDHRYEPRAYLEREFRLGYAALGFARTTPACALAMFRRDIATAEERAYSAAFVERERAGAARAMAPFESLARIPSDAVSGAHARELIALVYQQHLGLKRWMWRAGLLAAHEGRAITETRWPEA